jgi:uncharacterized membrane protein
MQAQTLELSMGMSGDFEQAISMCVNAVVVVVVVVVVMVTSRRSSNQRAANKSRKQWRVLLHSFA